MEALPDEHPVLCSWLEADDISQTLITSWQTATTGFDLDFDNYFCHYFDARLPSEVGRAGLGMSPTARCGCCRPRCPDLT